MKTALECLSEAERLAALARDCPDGIAREGYLTAADGWRRTALLARQQEAWAGAHPEA
jgi:hypothetical protein